MGDGIPTIGKVLAGLDATRKPLRKVIPRLSELRENPSKVLKEEQIEIKVSPPYGACTFIALFFPGILIVQICIHVLNWKPPGPEAAFTFLTWLLSSVLFGVFLGNLFNRGKIVLRLQGLEVHDRRSCILCPWSVFAIAGTVKETSESEISLPVQPTMVGLIEHHRNGEVDVTGKSVGNRHFRINSSETNAFLKDQYLVKGLKLGQLILEIAQALGATQEK
jgi:hypothetical protein